VDTRVEKPILGFQRSGKGRIMKKVFSGSSQYEANQKADEWWAGQKGLRKTLRTELAIGDEGPSLSDADRWVVTIWYEDKSSN
jgi:hypothetical protein